MKMDKIKEAFEKAFNLTEEYLIDTQEERAFILGYKAANSLPTEKICPECGGSGFDNNEDFTDDISKCSNCKNGIIQIYYTPEEYKTITGKDYPESACVWRKEVLKDSKGEYTIYHLMTYKNYKPYASPKILEKWLKTHQPYIVQTAQPAPEADYEI